MSKNKQSSHLKLFEKWFIKIKIYHIVNLKNNLMVAFNLVACHCVKCVQIRTRKLRNWTLSTQCVIVLVSIWWDFKIDYYTFMQHLSFVNNFCINWNVITSKNFVVAYVWKETLFFKKRTLLPPTEAYWKDFLEHVKTDFFQDDLLLVAWSQCLSVYLIGMNKPPSTISSIKNFLN